MATIAHLTDLHLVEDRYLERDMSGRARLSYLSFGRPLDPEGRRERTRRALHEARACSFDHLVITGDLTEDGADEQFEILAELLHESRISPHHVTVVPGNHDAYIDEGAFARALAGPLKPFAATSTPGAVVELRDVTFVPVSTAFHQTPLTSAGAIDQNELEGLARLARDPGLRSRPLVFAQHHPPGRQIPIVQWVDGLRQHATMAELFAQSPHLYVLHGHTHRATSKAIRNGEPARVFSAKAVVECESSLRLYEASPGGLSPVADDMADGVGVAAALPA
jgi:3',5'-cyclic-AMP phosphodiesterase